MTHAIFFALFWSLLIAFLLGVVAGIWLMRTGLFEHDE